MVVYKKQISGYDMIRCVVVVSVCVYLIDASMNKLGASINLDKVVDASNNLSTNQCRGVC
jgi:hypothetical protein